MAERANEGDTALAEFHVDSIVDESCQSVADERREKDERDDGVGEPVVFLKIWDDSPVGCVVHPCCQLVMLTIKE